MENWKVRLQDVNISFNNYIHTFCELLLSPIILCVLPLPEQVLLTDAQ